MIKQFANKKGPFTLLELEKISGAKAVGDPKLLASFQVDNIANIASAKPNELCVLHNKKYTTTLQDSCAGACVITQELAKYAPPPMLLLVHANPYKAFALIAQAFYPPTPPISYRSEYAYVASTAIIGENCIIEHGCYIGEHAVIGAQTKIGVNSYIGAHVTMGDNCIIHNNASIQRTIMGNRVEIFPGARIGQDGFGFASDNQGHYKIPHIGKVIIGNDVAIGANTCIDCGSLDDTVIGDHCRIDNLVQIGHNVKVGKGTVMAGQVGVAGSTEIGNFVRLAGQVGISGHIKIGDQVTVLGHSAVGKSVEAGEIVGGYPAVPVKEGLEQLLFLKTALPEALVDNGAINTDQQRVMWQKNQPEET